MIEVSFEIGGRKVIPSQISDALEKAVFKQVTENIKKSLCSVKCSVHGQQPRVTVKGHDLKHLEFLIRGCCDTLIEQAKKTFNK